MPRTKLHRFVVTGPLLAPFAVGNSIADAQDQAPPCPAYVIEGTIGTVAPDEPETARVASVYVHATGEPLSERQVIATFSDSSGAAIGEPEILVTDSGGRAEVAVPDSADSVNFVAETPDAPGCIGEDGTDPRVLLEIVPVRSPTGEPIADPGVPQPEEALAKTGPVSDVIALASLLLMALGASVGTGRGRRRAIAGMGRGVKRRFPR